MYVLLCTLWYSISVELPITEFRRQIFSLANLALDGEEVWFTHKGRRIKIVPEDQPTSRLSRITPIEIINPATSDLLGTERKTEMMAEIQKTWESHWESL